MTSRLFGSLMIAASCGLAAPVAAQDYLGTHLDTVREEAMRRHQQEQQAGASDSSTAGEQYNPPISGQARHSAMRRHHREYDRIRQAHGYRAADQWLADQVAAGR